MQYILTQEELDKLKELGREKKAVDKAKLQKFCTKVANEMSVKTWMGFKPWGCILTEEQEWYCDECPSKDICPHEHKEWSK